MEYIKYNDKLNDDEKIVFFNKQHEVYRIAQEFFERLGDLHNKEYDKEHDSRLRVSNSILPIICYNRIFDVITSIEQGAEGGCCARFVHSMYNKRQGVIYVGLSTATRNLTNDERVNLRHEIIHYCLWVLELSSWDYDLDFWIVSYAYNAHPYAPLDDWGKEKFDIFKSIYDERYYKYWKSNILGEILSEVLEAKYLDNKKWKAKLKRIANKYDKKYAGEEYTHLKCEKREYVFESDILAGCIDIGKEECENNITAFLEEFLEGKDYQLLIDYDDVDELIDGRDTYEHTVAHIKIILWDDIDEEALKKGMEQFEEM